ncbi:MULTISPECIES: TonB-dependent siderophore receptor [unclassified Caballeronia]|uniref:TonB-dependent siderophore receptor n=1 Tax=unclassified Caballeronia TaxID=2646786 RepID=UPI0028672449|nr:MULTISPECIES: TonB-dependent siderophore receptor [unclassified Caballeronia]MDR5777605.1 TonB-dependent siderophore receptor [Caballeronia sp. LZ002]MDR5798527.1 TonB-dependent siderophore receptor [Caballeronia sp. LZ001]MDR5853043.1 TonB-dependent siderophore receptor [Caballeronia sp. LZ003]
MLHPRFPLSAMTAAIVFAIASLDASDARAQTAAVATPASNLEFSIPAQPLGSALNELAREAHVQVLVDPSLVANRTAPAVTGRMSVKQAFERMLDGNRLVAASEGDTVTIREASAASTAAAHRAETALPAVSVTASGGNVQPPTEKTGSYTINSTTAGSKIALVLKETPQSVSVLTRAEMNDFQLNSVNDALRHVTGVTVEPYDSYATDFMSRGFHITNLQFDGVGTPLEYTSQYGDIDMSLYDRVEVLRGADGLNAETGNPSATVNFVRKRPTYEIQASGDVSYGSWDTKRIDVDISGPLNKAGTIAGRLVAVHQDGNSFTDRLQPSKDIVYGVVDINVTPSTLLTVGGSYEYNQLKGASWGGLPLLDASGNQLSYGVGTSLAPKWAYFNTQEQRAFAELTQQLGQRWTWKTTVNYNDIYNNAKFFYPYGSLNSDGSGVNSYTSSYVSSNRQLVLDSNVTGKLDLFGRTHDIVVGANFSRSQFTNPSAEGDGDGVPVAYADLLAGNYPEPVFGDATSHVNYLDVRRSLYASSRWTLTDRAHLLLGINYTQSASSGSSNGAGYNQQSSGSAPYIGLTYDLTKQITAYASFTKIFNPQTDLDANNHLLGPARGRSGEMGIKGAFFDNRLNTSLTAYHIRQSNIATQAGFNPDTANYYYTGGDATSQGVEAEVSGQITHDWNVSAGATILRVYDDNGQSTQLFVPRKSAHLTTTYRLPFFDHRLTLGSSVRWQSATRYVEDGLGTAEQGSYVDVDFMARYDVNRHFTITGTLNNALNRKYWATTEYNYGTYGAPLNGSVNLTWRY